MLFFLYIYYLSFYLGPLFLSKFVFLQVAYLACGLGASYLGLDLAYYYVCSTKSPQLPCLPRAHPQGLKLFYGFGSEAWHFSVGVGAFYLVSCLWLSP